MPRPQLISPLYCTESGGNRDCDVGASTSDAGLFGGVLIGGGILGASSHQNPSTFLP